MDEMPRKKTRHLFFEMQRKSQNEYNNICIFCGIINLILLSNWEGM